MNRIQAIGHLGGDPKLVDLKNDRQVANFSLATNRRYRDPSGERVEETTWLSCSAFGKLADTIGTYMQKGSKVFLEGRLREEQWTDKEGQDQRALKVIVTALEFLDKRVDDPTDGADVSATQKRNEDNQWPDAHDYMDDDIPF